MITFLLSCEHASYHLPLEYLALYSDKYLTSHLGYDRGALSTFSHLREELNLWGVKGQYSRLLIDLNRSLDSDNLFSQRLRKLSLEKKESIIENYYHPYRQKVLQKIESERAKGYKVIHLSIHSFTPVLKREKRACHVGLLFDPARENEFLICQALFGALKPIENLIVAYNEPYSGIEDGLTRYLRECFSENEYVGIELEFNQNIIRQVRFKKILNMLCGYIKEKQLLDDF